MSDVIDIGKGCPFAALDPRLWVDVGRYLLRATRRRLAASLRILV